VIGLELVRHALDVENKLVLLEPVRAQIVNEREIRVRSSPRVGRRADIPRKIFPAVNLDSTFLPRLAIRASCGPA
jgi:hypothetical protein